MNYFRKSLLGLVSGVLALPLTLFAMNVIGPYNDPINPTSQISYPTIIDGTNQSAGAGVIGGAGTISGAGTVGGNGTVGGAGTTGGTTIYPGATYPGSFHYSNEGFVNTSISQSDISLVAGTEVTNNASVNGVLPQAGNVSTFVKSETIDGALVITGKGDDNGPALQDIQNLIRPERIDTYIEMKLWAENFVGNDLRIKRLYYKDSMLQVTYVLQAKLFGFAKKKYDLIVSVDTSQHTYALMKPRWIVLSKSDMDVVRAQFALIIPQAFTKPALDLMSKNNSFDNVSYMIEVLGQVMKSAYDKSLTTK